MHHVRNRPSYVESSERKSRSVSSDGLQNQELYYGNLQSGSRHQPSHPEKRRSPRSSDHRDAARVPCCAA